MVGRHGPAGDVAAYLRVSLKPTPCHKGMETPLALEEEGCGALVETHSIPQGYGDLLSSFIIRPVAWILKPTPYHKGMETADP